jgi:RNA polymerase sigma factor (sigma-70 family)
VDPRSDSDLLTELRREPAALGVLYERHASAVYRYLARRVGVGAAEDLLGDVFVAALTARKRVFLHASRSALPWLYGIAANVVRAHLRRRSDAVPTAEVDGMDWDAVDARLDATSRSTELRWALQALTPTERELMLLVAWEGLSVAEAASALRLRPATARSRLHRARLRAQAALDNLPATQGDSREAR